MKAGTELSAFCYLEAKLNRVATGEQCTHLRVWIDHEFPLIKRDLARASGATVADFETYKTNLAAILAISEVGPPPFHPRPPPKL